MSNIDRVIEKAKAEGNEIESVSEDWEKVRQVFHMQADISDLLWAEITVSEPGLRAWASEATPHNRVERGFTDDMTAIAVSFPRT
jgi:hypothetical protein